MKFLAALWNTFPDYEGESATLEDLENAVSSARLEKNPIPIKMGSVEISHIEDVNVLGNVLYGIFALDDEGIILAIREKSLYPAMCYEVWDGELRFWREVQLTAEPACSSLWIVPLEDLEAGIYSSYKKGM